jgi:hypothetical protein
MKTAGIPVIFQINRRLSDFPGITLLPENYNPLPEWYEIPGKIMRQS